MGYFIKKIGEYNADKRTAQAECSSGLLKQDRLRIDRLVEPAYKLVEPAYKKAQPAAG